MGGSALAAIVVALVAVGHTGLSGQAPPDTLDLAITKTGTSATDAGARFG